MTPTQLAKLDKQLSAYLDYLTEGMGRPERRRALSWYLTGLLLDGERKTVVSMASRLVEKDEEVEAMRQRLQQCVTISAWADEEVRRRLALRLEEVLKPDAYVLDDTGFPKKGAHSVGVGRQYSGTLGRVDNCQVAPSLHVASDEGSGCVGMRLYLPEDWASDIERRRAAGVPDDIVFKRKWEIALDLLDEQLAAGLPRRLVLADAGYGDCCEFRDGLTSRGCNYLVGVSGIRLVWPPGSNPREPTKRKGSGRPRSQYRDGNRKPIALSEIAETLDYRKYSCADGKGGSKSGYFAFARVRSAERHTKGRKPSGEIWLIAEWRPGNNERKFYFSDLPATTPKHELVRLVKLRWRVERDYQEMKGEVGLDHFEGRTWRGFHHHVTLCAAAHGFLAIQRRLFPPEDLPLDAADGAPSHSDDPHRADRAMPALPTAFRSGNAGARALQNVIKWY
jgi:SRSO17 transposase